MKCLRQSVATAAVVLLTVTGAKAEDRRVADAPLPNTQPLTLSGDIAAAMVDGIDRFLLRETEESVTRRSCFWPSDTTPADASARMLEADRQRLAEILGVRDARTKVEALEFVGNTKQPALVGRGKGFDVFAVRWPVFDQVSAEGLLLVPTGREPVAQVIAIADADQTPEQIVGLVEGIPPESQFARRLAESGCRVLVPQLISRKVQKRVSAQLTNREYIYRAAFELGRHVIGYEVQQVLAAVDFFQCDAAGQDPRLGIIGYGEGGATALYAAALDTRIDAVCVSGFFGPREDTWQEPADRNVFGLLQRFGGAELAAMVAPRRLVIEAAQFPAVEIPPGTGGAPGRLVTPTIDAVNGELKRAVAIAMHSALPTWTAELIEPDKGADTFGSAAAIEAFLSGLTQGGKLAPLGPSPEHLRHSFDPTVRQQALVEQLDRHTQRLLADSPYVRKEFFQKLDTSSPQAFEKSAQWYREYFYNDVIGRFDRELMSPNVRSRKAYDEPTWTGYEVVFDVFPDVIAYGLLLIPKDIAPGQRRPVVVCQHGLEGRPTDCLQGGKDAYSGFANRLVERGYVVFAPQNPYLFKDRFRTLQRKANPLGKTLFSIIVPQHQQITDWLKTLPFVDGQHIAFYGLSYGGKTAMRVPPLVENYCLSICSGDFNDWVWKTTSTCTHQRYSYVWHGEYEIFEFNLGNTFNYAEMAALIAPRPFMVERGHFDGVAPDDRVAAEFAKVRNLYQARLGLGNRCRIEWFVGGHKINGVGTFEFLGEWLK